MVAQLDIKYCSIRPTKVVSRIISYVLFEGRPLTTKGQWINPFLFKFYSIICKFSIKNRAKKPIFILGTGRSGTTVLGVTLSMHRDIGFLNEPKAIWHFVYPNEDLIGSYSRGEAKYRLFSADVQQGHIDRARKVFSFYLRIIFSNRLVDKYPELIFRTQFVKKIFPDAKFIFLMRNGWDTCYSIDNWSCNFSEDTNGEIHDWWGADRRKWNLLVEQILPEHPDLNEFRDEISRFSNQRDMAAIEWVLTMREGLRLLELYPEDVIPLRFESISQNPESTLEELSKLLELSSDKKFIEYAKFTLHPVNAAPSFDLHPCIVKPFHETLAMLGYE